MDTRPLVILFACRLLRTIAIVGLSSVAFAATDSSCDKSGVTLQVLGSGGPIADDGRASAAYVVWVEGASRILIDFGGGAFLRFAQAGGDFNDIDFIGVSHFHADHSADLASLFKSGYFSKRTRGLTISGPSGREPFPGLHDYLESLIGKQHGAYRYLSGYLDGSGGLPALEQVEVASNATEQIGVFASPNSAVRVSAMNMPHGIVPALAYRVQIGDTSIVFAGDQNGSNERFIDFAKDASIMVVHMPVPEGVTGAGRKLHAPPSVIGTFAADANADQLMVSHLMVRSLENLDDNIAIVETAYAGPIHVADDLFCIALDN